MSRLLCTKSDCVAVTFVCGLLCSPNEYHTLGPLAPKPYTYKLIGGYVMHNLSTLSSYASCNLASSSACGQQVTANTACLIPGGPQYLTAIVGQLLSVMGPCFNLLKCTSAAHEGGVGRLLCASGMLGAIISAASIILLGYMSVGVAGEAAGTATPASAATRTPGILSICACLQSHDVIRCRRQPLCWLQHAAVYRARQSQLLCPS